MFTGLVEGIGTIRTLRNNPDSRTFEIEASAILDDVRSGDSIAVNGCCLTVEEASDASFTCTAIKETLHKTTFGERTVGDNVNLERAMRLGSRLGGHLVQGHIDTVAQITRIIENQAGRELWIAIHRQWRPYVIPTGSVCVDGISLTVADLSSLEETNAWFKVAIIPHTAQVTTIGQLHEGSHVNIEFDMMGKYALQRL